MLALKQETTDINFNTEKGGGGKGGVLGSIP